MQRERHGRGWQNDGIFPFKLTRGTPTAQILLLFARVVPLPISTITKTCGIRAAMASPELLCIKLVLAKNLRWAFTISCIP